LRVIAVEGGERARGHRVRDSPTGYLANLIHESDDTIRATLLPLRGIGPWSIDMLMMFGLGRLDVWPTGDLAVRIALGRLYGHAETPNPKETAALGEKLRPYRSIAAWYLWRSYEPEGSW
jgi:DNA-3-methyladenine glycosylase II